MPTAYGWPTRRLQAERQSQWSREDCDFRGASVASCCWLRPGVVLAGALAAVEGAD